MDQTPAHCRLAPIAVAMSCVALGSFLTDDAQASYTLVAEVSSQQTNADAKRIAGPPTIQTSVSGQDNQTIFFNRDDKNSGAFNAFNTAIVRPGLAHTLASGTTLLGGEISRFDSITGLAEQNLAFASVDNDVLTFEWAQGFDDTKPIDITFHQTVSQLNFTGTGFFPRQELSARLLIERVAGTGDLEAEIRFFANQNNINTVTYALTESVTAQDGAAYEMDFAMTALANTGSTDAFREGSAGAFAFAQWWVSVPNGVLVSSTSGHDYTQVLPASLIPEPSLGLVLAAPLFWRRRRQSCS